MILISIVFIGVSNVQCLWREIEVFDFGFDLIVFGGHTLLSHGSRTH